MATTKRKGLPEAWVTGLAKYLVGANPCLLQLWLPARFRFDPIPGDETKLNEWKQRHTDLLSSTIAKYEAQGWKTSVERYLRVAGTTAILTGKTDLIIQKANERPTVVDCKGGKPEDSDVAQVSIYQYAVPKAWHSPDMQFHGRVVYATHSVEVPHSDAQAIKPRLFALLQRIGSEERPKATPSESACRWCRVPDAECPDKIRETEAPVGVLTNEF